MFSCSVFVGFVDIRSILPDPQVIPWDLFPRELYIYMYTKAMQGVSINMGRRFRGFGLVDTLGLRISNVECSKFKG